MAITISVTSGSGYAGSTYTQTGAAGAGNWRKNGVDISGATSSTFVMDTENEGGKIDFHTASPDETSNILEFFIPSDVPNLTHWYDAYADETLTLATADVTTMTSRIGSVSLGQATTGNKPDYSATGRNSKPAISFDGTDDFFTFSDSGSALPSNTAPSTVFAHAWFVNTTALNWRVLSSWGAGGSGTSRIFAKSSGEFVAHTGGSAGTDNISAISWPNLDKIVIDEQISTASNIYIDGNTTPVTKSATYNSGTTTHAYIGRSPSGQYWQGGFQEYGIFSGQITSDNMRKIEGYLAHKWGTTALLPGGHPYKTNPPLATSALGSIAFGDMVVAGTMAQPDPFVGSIAFTAMTVTGVMAQDFTGAIAFDSMIITGLVGHSFVGAFAFDAMVAAGEIGQKFVGSAVFGAMEVAGVAIHEFTGAVAFSPMEVAGGLSFGGAFTGAAAFADMVVGGTMTFVPHFDVTGAIAFGDMVVAGTLTFGEAAAFTGAAVFGDMVTTGVAKNVYIFEGTSAFAEMTATGVAVFTDADVVPIVWDAMEVNGELSYIAPDVIVEDGSVVPNANSYVTIAFVDSYLGSQGYGDYVATDLPSKIAAVMRATIGIDGTYGQRYPGKKVAGRQQSLLWPRTEAEDNDGNEIAEDEIPTEIMKASAEAAYLEWLQPGYMTPNWTPDQLTTSETLGPLSVTYSDPSKWGRGGNLPTLSKIDQILAPLIGGKVSLLFGETTRG